MGRRSGRVVSVLGSVGGAVLFALPLSACSDRAALPSSATIGTLDAAHSGTLDAAHSGAPTAAPSTVVSTAPVSTTPVGSTPRPAGWDGTTATSSIPSQTLPEIGHNGPTSSLPPDAYLPFDLETFRVVADKPAAAAGSRTDQTHPPLELTLPLGTLVAPEVHGPALWSASLRPDAPVEQAWEELAWQFTGNSFTTVDGADVPLRPAGEGETVRIRKGGAATHIEGTLRVSGGVLHIAVNVTA